MCPAAEPLVDEVEVGSLLRQYRRMNARPRASLARILEDLGSTVLDVAVCPDPPPSEVTTVAVHDPEEHLEPPAGALVLGVGVADPGDLLLQLGRHAASALVVRGPLVVDESLREAVRSSGVALLSASNAASWTQILLLVRTVLLDGELDERQAELTGNHIGELFALANAVGAALDTPVTIEDRSARVVAFSADQAAADAPRAATVLARQVPQEWQRRLADNGVFERLYRTSDPVWVDLGDADVLPRMAVAVRAGEEVLGAMWAAVRRPFTADEERAFVAAAKTAALHLLQQRAAENAGKWRRSELVRRVLTGGSGAELAARRLELAEVPLCVVAAEPSDRHEDGAERELAAERLCELLGLHLAVRQSKVATASALGTAYAILPLTTADPDAESRNALGSLRGFATRRDAGAVVGMGRVAWSPGETPRSRADADAVLDVLRSGDRRTARVDEVWERLFLARLRDLVVDDEELRDGPVQALTAYDADHHGQLVATLSAYLDAFGDVARTAQVMHVHPNTLRYRLRRITEVSGLDLSNPDARLAVGLQLRVQGG